jgi:hypothetical protein
MGRLEGIIAILNSETCDIKNRYGRPSCICSRKMPVLALSGFRDFAEA